MKLSLRFFYTKIQQQYPSAILSLVSDEMPTFSSLSVINDSMSAKRQLLYIDLAGDGTTDLPQGTSVVTTKKRSESFKGCNLIMVPDDTDPSDIFQIVSNTFMRYLEWADSLYLDIAKNASLQTLIENAASILENPLYIADTSFKMIASWSGEFSEVNPVWSYQERYLYLPYDVMQALTDSGEIDTLFNTPDAWIVENSAGFPNSTFISKAIRKDGIHYGNFFIMSFYNQLTYCDLEIADYVGDILSNVIQGNPKYLETTAPFHNHFLEDVVEGTLVDKRIMIDQLKALHWQMQGDYMIALFNTVEDSDAMRRHIMALLTSELNAECFIYRGNAVAIFNNSSHRKEAINKLLQNIASNFKRSAATSEGFSDFGQIRKYYYQASFALNMASERDSHGKVLEYSDVFLYHLANIVDSAIPSYPPTDVLQQHDADNGTDYCHTLLVWLLNDRNTILTASELYVHRNTLKNRLERIIEILNVDMDDPRIRMRLRLSLFSQQKDRASTD